MSYRFAVVLIGCLTSIAAVTAAGPCWGAKLTLVEDGRANCSIVLGDKATGVQRTVADVLQARIQKRSGCKLAIIDSKDAQAATAKQPLAIVLGTSATNPLVARLCKASGRPVPNRETVGPGGFVIHTFTEGGKTRILLAGADDWGRADWRWGILQTRVELEDLDQRAAATGGWVKRLDITLAGSLSKDDAALATALDKVRGDLVRLNADFDRMQQQSDRLTKHLYVDLYGTPKRNQGLSRLGIYRVSLPRLSLLMPLVKRCDALAALSKATQRREEVKTLLKTLRAQVRYATDASDLKPVLRVEGATIIPGSWFKGGAAMSLGADQLLTQGATVIGSSGSKAHTVSIEFDFEPGEEPLRLPIKLTLRGMDPSGSKPPIEITVNGQKVFSGKSQFSSTGFSERVYEIRPGYIGKGKNRLEVKNLAAGGPEQAIRLAAARLEATREE